MTQYLAYAWAVVLWLYGPVSRSVFLSLNAAELKRIAVNTISFAIVAFTYAAYTMSGVSWAFAMFATACVAGANFFTRLLHGDFAITTDSSSHTETITATRQTEVVTATSATADTNHTIPEPATASQSSLEHGEPTP